jgi:hypothetical protein
MVLPASRNSSPNTGVAYAYLGFPKERRVFGLALLGAATVYVVGVLVAVAAIWRIARGRGFSRVAAAASIFVVVLALYLPVFWNHLPTAIAFRSACDKDAGFQARVPAAEWARKNQGQLAKLSKTDLDQIVYSAPVVAGKARHLFFGGLLVSESLDTNFRRFGVPFYRVENRLFDGVSGEELSRRVDYSLGTSGDIRFWLVRPSCFEREASPVLRELDFVNVLKGN